jgi:hypothetical protein
LQRPTFNGEDEGTLAARCRAGTDIVTTAADPDLAVALTEKHLYRSRDGGETWSVLPNVPEWPTAVDLGQQTAGVVYLGTLTGGAFRSTDAGDTWQALSPDLGLLPGTFMQVTALAVNPEDEETVYVATGYWLGTTEMHFTPVGVFLSVDGGATWVQVHESELSEPMVTALKPAPGDPMTVQTATANDGLGELCAPGGVDRVAADCGP